MEKLNIAELLKDCPSGMELDCLLYDNVTFERVADDGIWIKHIDSKSREHSLYVYNDGSFPIHNLGSLRTKCIIFPKDKTTWDGFQKPFKSGDIVTQKDGGLLVACIYKERKNTAAFNHYIALYMSGLGIIKNGQIALPDDELCFASEEEKQKLFDAIKSNGYKWNAETKTLEKSIKPKFKVGDKIKHKSSGLYCTIGEYSKGISAYRTNIGLSLTYKDLEQWELAPNKFDITTLKPFDKVLVRGSDVGCWMAHLFSFYDTNCITIDPYKCISQHNGGYAQCIPYEGNEHLLGTPNDCDDFYKTW